MTRLRSPTIKYASIIVVGVLFVYGLYAYHNVSTLLRNVQDKLSHVSQQHDSVSAQLQVVYEHKSRLEKTVEQEIFDHKKTKEDLKRRLVQLENENEDEKKNLLSRIDSIGQQNKMLQDQIDDQQVAYNNMESKLKDCDEFEETASNCGREKQELENDIARLKDNVADLNRDLQNKEQLLDKHKSMLQQQLQQQQRLQQNLYNNPQQNLFQLHQQQQPVQQQQQPLQQQQQLQQQQLQQQQQPLQFQQQQPQEQHVQPAQHQQLPLQQQPLPNAQQPVGGNEFHKLQSLRQEFGANQAEVVRLQGDGGPGPAHLGAVVASQQVQEQQMQINKPDKPGYFEPKLPDDTQILANVKQALHAKEDNERAGQIVQEQVLPPKHDEDSNNDKDNAAEIKDDAKMENFDFALKHRRDMVYEEDEDEDDDDDDNAAEGDDNAYPDGDDGAADDDAPDDDAADLPKVIEPQLGHPGMGDVNNDGYDDAVDDRNKHVFDDGDHDNEREEPNDNENDFNHQFEMHER